jgi:plasmid maintenance system antidote protein VapI
MPDVRIQAAISRAAMKMAEMKTSVGEILVFEYMVPRGLTITTLSLLSGISKQSLVGLIEGTVGMNYDISTRLANALGESSNFWEKLAETVSWTERQRCRSKMDAKLKAEKGTKR